ncbi:MAG: dephospho-CoA kinase [Candidatus Bipolaricaulota bacterium]|nr:dephospho-CoA kinase [Candidatus Bipolaricaulota bacterium]MDW8126320.1 dephospho-CoA kinase [Candidatus Bipolaricaulota bacterium]
MWVIGVTGPAGSGKSTVCRILARQPGFVHIDCDRLGWETYQPNGPAYAHLLARFGNEILAEDGSIDKKKLSKLVFSDPKAKADLEALVHPHIMAAVKEALSRERGRGGKVALVEGALLLVSPHVDRDLFDLFVWLSVPQEERRARLRAAGVDEETIEHRFLAQANLTPPNLPNVLVIDGCGSAAEVACRVLHAIRTYLRTVPTNS